APGLHAPPPSAEPSRLRILHLNFHRGWGGQPRRFLFAAPGRAGRGLRVAWAVPGDSLLPGRGRHPGLTAFGDGSSRPPPPSSPFRAGARTRPPAWTRGTPSHATSPGPEETGSPAGPTGGGGEPRLPPPPPRHNTKAIADSPANRYLYGRCIDLLVVP